MKPIHLPAPLQINNHTRQFLYSLFSALSSNSLAISAAGLGISGITHFTLPALISSCAILQGLRECVSITRGAPPRRCPALPAAPGKEPPFPAEPSLHFTSRSP